jgi:thiol:disulfide interchange protein DsbD
MARMVWILGLLAALCLPGLAGAAESKPVASPRATATLVSDTDAVAAGQPFRVGLRLRLAPGWHTYWRNPGDAGVPAELAFSLPAGMSAGPVAWPAPSRQPEGDLMTYGYSGEVLLPVTITGGAGGTVRLHASWLVCGNICVPEEGDFALDLPAGTPAPSAQAALFAAGDARTPRPSPWPARLAPDGTLTVTTSGAAAAAVRDAWFMPDTADAIEANAPQPFEVTGTGLTLRLKLAAGRKPPLTGVLAIADRSGQTSFHAISAPDGPPAAAATPLLEALGLAFLGGLILNLMPCVFPVLALKAVGLARLSGAERRHARAHAGAYAAGVIVTFVALGGALLALRAAGEAAGWGFQFQSPVFVGLMALLLFGVGLNLSGVYRLDFGGTLAGAGQSLAGRAGLAGSFFAGLLAVLVATPCTAPFMAPAIAAGLAGSPAVTLVVFAAMGAGLAVPYALLAGLPALTRALPRPGAWMEVLRQALAFPMYAASVWLIWVLSQQSGPLAVLLGGAGLLLLGLSGWLLGLAQAWPASKLRHAGTGLSLAALVAALVLVAGLDVAPPSATEAAGSGAESFTAARLAALREAGRPVFVNMTAAWCVTCLVNERVALAPEAVRAAFAARGVAYLKGDWTRQNPEITAFLRAHARDGVPLYVMYPGGHRAEEVLPQILTEGTVLAALK